MPTLSSVEFCEKRGVERWDELLPLLEQHLPRWSRGFDGFVEPARLRGFQLRRIVRLLSHADAIVLSAEAGGRVVGVSCLTPLPWDSKMFGFSAARLEFAFADLATQYSLVDATVERARRCGIRHVVARVDASDQALIRTLERLSFEEIDGIQTFSLDLRDFSTAPSAASYDIRTRLFEAQDLEQVLGIARSSYVFDRFHADSAIDSDTANRINEEWLLNSCAGQAADAVVVAVEGSVVLGYATCKIDSETREGLGVCFGSIVMVATAENSRNKGVAMACTAAAIGWFQGERVDVVQVGTQIRNVPAGRLYEKCGFLLTSRSFTLRRML